MLCRYGENWEVLIEKQEVGGGEKFLKALESRWLIPVGFDRNRNRNRRMCRRRMMPSVPPFLALDCCLFSKYYHRCFLFIFACARKLFGLHNL